MGGDKRMKTFAALIAGILIGNDQDGLAIVLLFLIWLGVFDSQKEK